ncbi:ABC transporter substrate-binding protein [Paenibacillus assamensis]|uniref:ABC transporter substrate-binding protein n=1 Tax=Paenibacillus assamensis TaxID=311244 RepID=UPI00040EE7F6|nr:extracellular solute-binding protein [Paenibacillus assamensis]
MKKGLVLLTTLLFIATTALTGCGGGAKESGSSNGTTTPETKTDTKTETSSEPFDLKLRHTQVGESKKNRFNILQDVVKKTEGEIAGLSVKLDGVESEVNRKEKLRAEMTNGDPPDIFDAFGSPDVKLYAENGLVADIAPILDELGIKDDFLSHTQWEKDGKIYGLPVGASIEGYFYNKEYFEKNKIEIPKTLAELEAIAEKVKQDGKIPFAIASKDAWVPLMTTNNLWTYYAGADVTKGFAKGETKWNDPKMIEAFAKHADWLKKGYFKQGELGLEYATQRNQIINEEAIMMYDGSWATSVFADKAQSGKMHGKVGFFMMPPLNAGDGYSIMFDSNNGYAFSQKAIDDPKKREAIKAFIKNLYNEEMQLRGLKEDGVIPSMKVEQAKLNETAKGNDLLEAILAQMGEVKYTWPAFDALVQADVNTALSQQIQKMISGQATPQQVGDEVQKVQDEANAAE